MVATAVIILPGIILPLSNEGMVKLRLNFSGSSAMLSLDIGTLIVVSVDPAVKVALIGSEI